MWISVVYHKELIGEKELGQYLNIGLSLRYDFKKYQKFEVNLIVGLLHNGLTEFL